MGNDFLIQDFFGKKICLRGVGKMFYQEGFPVSMAVSKFKEQGIEVSLFHVADECLKNGWSAKTTINKLKSDFEDAIESVEYDFESLELFCNSDYETQREMIFEYLFKGKDVNEIAGIFKN